MICATYDRLGWQRRRRTRAPAGWTSDATGRRKRRSQQMWTPLSVPTAIQFCETASSRPLAASFRKCNQWRTTFAGSTQSDVMTPWRRLWSKRQAGLALRRSQPVPQRWHSNQNQLDRERRSGVPTMPPISVAYTNIEWWPLSSACRSITAPSSHASNCTTCHSVPKPSSNRRKPPPDFTYYDRHFLKVAT